MIDTSLTSFHFYFLVAIFQGFILSLIIIFRKPIKKPNIYFGLFIFFSSLSLLHGILESSIHAFNAKFIFPMEYGFLIGPLAYFHVKYIVDPHFIFSRKHILHFLPSLVFDVMFFIVLFCYVRFNMAWANANVNYIQTIFLSLGILFLIQLTTYLLFIYRTVKSTNSLPKEFSMDINTWFKTSFIFVIVIIGILAVVFPIAISNIELFDENSFIIYNPLGIIKSVGIYALGYLYLLKYMAKINRHLEKSESQKFSQNEITQRRQQLINAIEGDELYRNASLTVEQLARHLGWSQRDLSTIVSQGFTTNFNDLINTYRIQAFKAFAVTSESRKYSIMGIAQEVGFNSKASFYRAFKKTCDETPSEFLASKGLK